MKAEVKKRLTWVRLYEKHQDAGFVCRKCGISRPTLRKWWNRYKKHGLEGLESVSKKPHTSPNRKIHLNEEALILELRKSRNLGARRIQSELIRIHNLSLSLATIHNTSHTKDRSLAIEFKWAPARSLLGSISTQR